MRIAWKPEDADVRPIVSTHPKVKSTDKLQDKNDIETKSPSTGSVSRAWKGGEETARPIHTKVASTPLIAS